MTECKRPGWLFNRCKFEPRYSVGPSCQLTKDQIDAISEACVWSEDTNDAIRLMTRGHEKYEGDICVKCGSWRAPSGI